MTGKVYHVKSSLFHCVVFHWGDERFGDDWPARHRSRPKESVSAAQDFRSGEAGERDFQSTPALKENPLNAITIFDYHRLLSKAGWKVTHRIECPLSSERLSGNQVQKMQDKRILGTVGRTLIIGSRV